MRLGEKKVLLFSFQGSEEGEGTETPLRGFQFVRNVFARYAPSGFPSGDHLSGTLLDYNISLLSLL